MKNIIKSFFNKIKLSGIGVLFLLLIASCSNLNKAEKLYNAGDKAAALSMAIEYLNSNEINEQIQAINLIGKIGGNEAGKVILPKVDSTNYKIRLAAIKQLGVIKYKPAAEKMLKITPQVKGEIFEETATTIREIGTSATNLLIKKFNNTSKKEPYQKMLVQVGPSITEAVIGSLKGKSYFQNRYNYELLIELRSPKVASMLLAEIHNEEVADMIVDGLIKLGKLSVNPTIDYLAKIKQSKNIKPVMVEHLAKILGEIKDPRSLTILGKFTKFPNQRVRNAIDHAIKMIRGF